MTGPALQDQIPHNHCFGCGPDNSRGLRIKSFWDGVGPSVASFQPQPHHCAGPAHFVNGGIIATLIDCHCVCTATAAAYFAAGRAVGSEPHLHFATTSLRVDYLRPVPLTSELQLAATVTELRDRRYVLSCELKAAGKVCASASVEAAQVPESWTKGLRRDV